jgi:hypothetical protein
MNIADPPDPVDQALGGFDVARIAIHVSERRLNGTAEPHHAHPHFPQDVFPILPDAQIAMAKHGEEQRSHQTKDKLRPELHAKPNPNQPSITAHRNRFATAQTNYTRRLF